MFNISANPASPRLTKKATSSQRLRRKRRANLVKNKYMSNLCKSPRTPCAPRLFSPRTTLPHCSRVAVLSQGQLWNAHAMFQQCFSMRPHNMLEPRCWDDQCSSNFSAIFASFWPLTVPYMTPTQFFALYLNLLSKKHVFSPQYSTYIMITWSSNLRKSCDFFE